MKTTTTVINKASIDLGVAQDLSEFSDNMRDAAKAVYPSAEWMYVAQITPSSAVVWVESSTDWKYYQHDWSIQEGFPILGSESTIVEPETEYRPKRG